MTYLIITKEDADLIATALRWHADRRLSAIRERLERDTGGDIQGIADELKKTEICAPCHGERMQASCSALGVQRLGRRLTRLLERARGER